MNKNILLLFVLSMYSIAINAQNNKWSLGVDYVFVPNHQDFYQFKYYVTEKNNISMPKIYMTYSYKDNWGIYIGAHAFGQRYIYEVGHGIKGLPPNQTALTERSFANLDVQLGKNIGQYLFQQSFQNKFSLWIYGGLRTNFAQSYIDEEVLDYFEYIAKRPRIRNEINAFSTLKPSIALQAKYYPIHSKRFFVSAATSWSYFNEKNNPFMIHLGIGFDFGKKNQSLNLSNSF